MKVILVLITATFLMASCRSTRKIQTAIAKKDTIPVVVTPVQSGEDSAAFIRETLGKLNSHRIDFNTFSAKIDVDYHGQDGKKQNVNAVLRMEKNKAIWISITGLFGVEGLRALITEDSVKVLNKLSKEYTQRSVGYLQEMTQLPLDLYSLQNILIGNPVFVDTNIVSYYKSGNTVSLISLGEWFKNLLTLDTEAKIENSKLDDVDLSRSRTCNLSYADYESKKGVNFSTKRRITVSEKSNLDIKLDFKQYEFNETLSFPFSIPKSYERNEGQ